MNLMELSGQDYDAGFLGGGFYLEANTQFPFLFVSGLDRASGGNNVRVNESATYPVDSLPIRRNVYDVLKTVHILFDQLIPHWSRDVIQTRITVELYNR